MSEPVPLLVDPTRLKRWGGAIDANITGIYVRARHEDKPVSVDIALLDQASLRHWLRSRGGDNPWAENTVALLLDHYDIHEPRRVTHRVHQNCDTCTCEEPVVEPERGD